MEIPEIEMGVGDRGDYLIIRVPSLDPRGQPYFIVQVPVWVLPPLADYLKGREEELKKAAVAWVEKDLEEAKKRTALAKNEEGYYRSIIRKISGKEETS
jgi:hypothetical protein